jgi:hypothetical protein
MVDRTLVVVNVFIIIFAEPQNISTHPDAFHFKIPHWIDIGLVVLSIVDEHTRVACAVKLGFQLVLCMIGHDADLSPFL